MSISRYIQSKILNFLISSLEAYSLGLFKYIITPFFGSSIPPVFNTSLRQASDLRPPQGYNNVFERPL